MDFKLFPYLTLQNYATDRAKKSKFLYVKNLLSPLENYFDIILETSFF